MALAKFDEEIRESYYERMHEREWCRTTTTPATSSSNHCYAGSNELSKSKVPHQKREVSYQGMILLCRSCGCLFPFTAQEQIFYAKKNFVNPKRCKACRPTQNLVADPPRVDVWRYAV